MRSQLVFISLLMLLMSLQTRAQERVTTFGLQLKPMISGSLINEGNDEVTEGAVKFQMNKLSGYSAGMVIRKGLSKMFSLETGISFVKRNYELKVIDEDRNYEYSSELGIVAYEVPVLGLVYIQLSKAVFMNTSFGFSFDMFPSDVAEFSQDSRIIMEGKRKNWLQPALTANIGWEYRTPKSGSFYLGATYHRPFDEFYGFLMEYDPDPDDLTAVPTTLLLLGNGNYLTIDLRYFFHEDPEKKRLRREKRRN